MTWVELRSGSTAIAALTLVVREGQLSVSLHQNGRIETNTQA
jgi:hypothetical protein